MFLVLLVSMMEHSNKICWEKKKRCWEKSDLVKVHLEKVREREKVKELEKEKEKVKEKVMKEKVKEREEQIKGEEQFLRPARVRRRRGGRRGGRGKRRPVWYEKEQKNPIQKEELK